MVAAHVVAPVGQIRPWVQEERERETGGGGSRDRFKDA